MTTYHNAPIYLCIEENIDRITIKSDDLHITGRFDIVAVNRDTLNGTFTPLWILVIESKTLKFSAPFAPGFQRARSSLYRNHDRQKSKASRHQKI